MSVVVPSGFPLAQANGARSIAYRQPIVDNPVTELLIDGPTWAYASGQRTSWAWAFAGDLYVTGLAIAEVFRTTSVLSSDRTECGFRFAGANAKVTLTAEDVSGVFISSLVVDTGAGAAQVSGTLTGLSGTTIVYKIEVESTNGVALAGMYGWHLTESEITAGALP